jgi:hypothetical protein
VFPLPFAHPLPMRRQQHTLNYSLHCLSNFATTELAVAAIVDAGAITDLVLLAGLGAACPAHLREVCLISLFSPLCCLALNSLIRLSLASLSPLSRLSLASLSPLSRLSLASLSPLARPSRALLLRPHLHSPRRTCTTTSCLLPFVSCLLLIASFLLPLAPCLCPNSSMNPGRHLLSLQLVWWAAAGCDRGRGP